MKSMRFIRAALFSAVPLCGLALRLVAPASADVISDQLNQSQANRFAIFHDYSIDATGSSSGGIPNPSGGGLAESYFGRFAASNPVGDDKNWTVSATPLVGYDSNPEARQFARGSFFGGLGANATYVADFTPDDPTHVFANVGLTSAVYEGMVKEANVFQPSISTGIRHGYFDDSIVLSAQMKDQWTVEHGASYLNAFDLAPSMEYFWTRQLSTEVALDYANLEYFFPPAPKLSPDTSRYLLSFNLHLYPLPQGRNATVPESPDQLTDILRQSLHSVVMGYTHNWNQSEGQAYRYQANRLSIGFDGIRPLKSPDLNFSLYYAHEWQSYLSDYPLSTPSLNKPTVLQRRHDHLDIFTLRTDARLVDLAHDRGTLGAYVQWDLVRDFSFIPIRDFNEFIFSGGITFQY